MSRVRCAVVCRIKACSFRPLVGLVILRSAFSACTSPLSFIVISRGEKKFNMPSLRCISRSLTFVNRVFQ